jgi:hypothetical protein
LSTSSINHPQRLGLLSQNAFDTSKCSCDKANQTQMQDTDSPSDAISQSAEKLPKVVDRRGSNPNSRKNLIPFVKGDPRINRTGHPKNFEEFRVLARGIAAIQIADKNGNPITVAEAMLRSWAKSKEAQLQRAFIEYAFGKVPDKLDAIGFENKTTLILHYGHEKEKRDEDHQRLSTRLSRGTD